MWFCDVNFQKKSSEICVGFSRCSLVATWNDYDVCTFPGSNINLQANDGQSPLFLAAKLGHLDVVQLLIGAGECQKCSCSGHTNAQNQSSLWAENTRMLRNAPSRQSPDAFPAP